MISFPGGKLEKGLFHFKLSLRDRLLKWGMRVTEWPWTLAFTSQFEMKQKRADPMRRLGLLAVPWIQL